VNETTTYGSICTGYDGIGKGLTLAGAAGRTAWVAENEDAMARLLKRAAPRLKVLAHSEIPETHSIRIGSIIGGTA